MADPMTTPPEPVPECRQEPAELLLTRDDLASALRDAAGECEYQVPRQDSPALRDLAAASGTFIRQLARIAQAPTEAVAVSTWFTLDGGPRVSYQGTHDVVSLTLAGGNPTALTLRIDRPGTVLERLLDLLETARTELYRVTGGTPDDAGPVEVAPGRVGAPGTTVALGADAALNFEVDPVREIVHLYLGSWNPGGTSGLRLVLREPRPALSALVEVVGRLKNDHALLPAERQHFSWPRPLSAVPSDAALG